MRCADLRYASVTRSDGFPSYDATVAGTQASNSEVAETPRHAAAGGVGAGPLTRVRFSRDDLLLTRFAEAPAPLVEVSAGLLEMRRRAVAGKARLAQMAHRPGTAARRRISSSPADTTTSGAGASA